MKYGRLTETQQLNAKMLSIHFCVKQCFNKIAKVYFECFVRITNCCVYTTVVTITKITCPTEDRMSNIKTAHAGHHVRKGRILAEFLKIRCANS